MCYCIVNFNKINFLNISVLFFKQIHHVQFLVNPDNVILGGKYVSIGNEIYVCMFVCMYVYCHVSMLFCLRSDTGVLLHKAYITRDMKRYVTGGVSHKDTL